MYLLLQVPAEPVCQDVFGPTVPGNQQDFRPARCRPDPAVHVRWRPALWSAGLVLPYDAAHACGPGPAGASHACQICSTLVWDSLRDCDWWVSLSKIVVFFKKIYLFFYVLSFLLCVAVMTMMGLLKMKLKSDSVRLWSLWRTTWEMWFVRAFLLLIKRRTSSPLRSLFHVQTHIQANVVVKPEVNLLSSSVFYF